MNNKPQVKFEISDVEKEIINLKEILHKGSDLDNEKIFTAYPMLLRRLKKSTSDTESDKIISKFFRAAAKDAKGKAAKYKQVFQRIYNIVNDDFMNIISSLMNIKIEDNKIFRVNVTFSPITTYNTGNDEFSIYLKTKTRKLKDIVFGGVTELLLNKKFKSLIGETNEDELKNHFMELIAIPVLTDNKMQGISIYKPIISSEYTSIIIGDNVLPNIIKKMYKDKTSFDEFMKSAWELMLKNKEIITEQFKNNALE